MRREELLRRVPAPVKAAVCAITLLCLLGFGISSEKATPDHALVFVDVQTKTYFAPVCLGPAERLSKLLVTAGEAKKHGGRADAGCQDTGAFVQEDRSLSGLALQALGLLRPVPSRWNADGSWNW